MLRNILSLLVLIVSVVFVRFSTHSPLYSFFHFSPALSPSFSGPCTIFPSGHSPAYFPNQKGFSFDPLSASPSSEQDLRAIAEQLGMRQPGLPHRYDLFNEYGQYVSNAAAQCQLRHGYLYLMRKREIWTWPAVSVGDSLQVDVTNWQGGFTLYTLTTLSTRPRVFMVENLVTPEEVAAIKTLAQAKMVKNKANEGGIAHASLNSSDGRVLARLDRRITDILRVPELLIKHQGGFDVARYRPGDASPPSHDYIEQEPEGGETHFIAYKRNYLATVIYYLEEPKKGGETCFPLSGKSSPDDTTGCAEGKGLKIKPKAGSAVIVYNIDSEDNMAAKKDPWAVREEMEVAAGEKWVAVRHIYSRAFPVDTILWRGPERVPYGFVYNYLLLPGDE